jgi:hypothetical protein
VLHAATCFGSSSWQYSGSRVDGQELRPEHVGVIINKNVLQQVCNKYCVCSVVVRTVYSFSLMRLFVARLQARGSGVGIRLGARDVYPLCNAVIDFGGHSFLFSA